MSTPPLASVDVLALGELDGGNLGNDGTFRVFLEGLRSEMPDVSVGVFGYGTERMAAQLAVSEATMNAPRRATGGVRGAVAKVTSRIQDFPRTARFVKRARVVVVPGTGLFEGDHGTSFVGWPLAFWRTAVACRFHRRPLIVVGVGASEVSERLSRALLKGGLRRADVITCRDERSATVIREWIGDSRPVAVTADLVFARGMVPAKADDGFVAVGVMAGGGGTAGTDERRHVDEMVALVEGLRARDRKVRLIIGDEVDRPALEEIASRLAPQGEVEIDTPSDLEGLIQLLSGASAVVATRFHNVIAALLSRRPTIAISYADKTRDLMEVVGMGDFVVDAARIDAGELLALFDRAMAADAGPDVETIEALQSAARRDVSRVAEVLR
jgi:polysaccharide pyruvyl transferase WcaK-like protein